MRPRQPIVSCAVFERVGGLLDAFAQGFIDAEDEVERPVKIEQRLFADIVNGRVGGQAQRRIGADIADMMRAKCQTRRARAIVEAWTHVNSNAWTARNWRESPHQRLRIERPISPPKARHEIRHSE